MKCENCGKNEVSFVYRSNINGKVEEKHLCQECAQKLGYTQKIQDSYSGFQSGRPLLRRRLLRRQPPGGPLL